MEMQAWHKQALGKEAAMAQAEQGEIISKI